MTATSTTTVPVEELWQPASIDPSDVPDEVARTAPRGQAQVGDREAQTTPSALPCLIEELAVRCFRAGKEERFEDGMESNFSRTLLSLLNRYGTHFIQAVMPLLVREKVNAEVGGETLRWLGASEHQSSHASRLWLLEHCLLNSSSPRIRDGAILGLSFMDDPTAIPYLQVAIEKEHYQELRIDIRQVLSQLESKLKCPSSSEKSARRDGLLKR